jgi:hypothetical protein
MVHTCACGSTYRLFSYSGAVLRMNKLLIYTYTVCTAGHNCISHLPISLVSLLPSISHGALCLSLLFTFTAPLPLIDSPRKATSASALSDQ